MTNSESNEQKETSHWDLLQKWDTSQREKRPKLIIEVASGRTGIGTTYTETKNAFIEGTHKDCRYLCIDPDPIVTSDITPYAFGLATRIQDPKIQDIYRGQAHEIYMRNIGSIVNKQDWFQAIYELLAPGGRVVIIDTYTPLLYQSEHEEYKRMLEKLGFDVKDHTMNAQAEIRKELLVQAALKPFNSGMPLIVELRKPSS